ncbi:glycosyl hydrolase [Neorhodopirellula lusitana]|uniref:glycosyl hydrolase n=1 Tax=Neorhodopirellula lusitana TaxID=445327 RepID=UPI0038510EEB
MNQPNRLSRRAATKGIVTSTAAAMLTQTMAFSDDPPSKAKSGKSQTGSSARTKVTPRRLITKKGICGKGTRCETTGAGWYYNWYWRPTPGQLDAEFVPMIKGKKDAIDRAFAHLETLKESHGVTHLLGFNEPDSESQGNTTVDKAVQLWPKLMDTGLRLGSPAVTDNRRGKDWFAAFMEQAAAKRFRIDFITVHRYPNIKGPQSVKLFFHSLQQIYQKYRLPIWVTEFSGLNFGSKDRKMTAATNLWFMKQTLPALNQLPYIERYAWYSGGAKDISHMYDRDHPDQLNQLGKFYRTV